MNPLKFNNDAQSSPFVRTMEDSRIEFTAPDRSRKVAPEPNEPERDIFAIARVIAERGYRNRNLRRASSIF
jgi:hypothetical protein